MFLTYCENGVTSGGEEADTWPYVSHLVEELHEHLVGRIFLLALRAEDRVDGAMDTGEVGHHTSHHTAWQTAAEEQ